MTNLSYGSVCSGIESASVAWEPLGFTPSWFSEIEPFPSAVLAHHWPHIANMGDMNFLPDMIAAGLIDAPAVLVGGTPCQAFSVAGNRGGLGDERGQLTLKYIEVLNAIDERRPDGEEAVAVWENVPGVLSSKDNAFGCFLGGLVGAGGELQPPGRKWDYAGYVAGPQRRAAWRVLDAQYFGVAQRRRRVFVVTSARDGFDPRAVLFECEGLRRDTPPSREAREDVADTVTAGARKQDINGGRNLVVPNISKCLTAKSTGAANLDYETADFVVEPFTPSSFGQYTKGIGTLRANGGDLSGGRNLVVPNISKCLTAKDLAFTLGTNNGAENAVYPIHDKTTRHAGKTGKGSGNGLGVGTSDDPCPTLTAGDRHAVAFAQNSRNELRLEGGDGQITGCLSASSSAKPGQGHPTIAELSTNLVRRLIPVECERLQGFEDNHTRVPYRNKPAEECPDGPRYKAIGNSKAIPCVRWVGQRLKQHLEELETHGRS